MVTKRKITICDVAKDVGLSVSTVSSVLNGKTNFAEKTVKKVWDAANRLQYTPSASARGLRYSTQEKRRETGVVLHILHTSSTPNPGSEAERSLFLMTMEAQKRNYCAMHYLYQEEKGFRCPQLMNGLVDGVLIGTPHCDVINAVAEKIPTVLMDLPFVREQVKNVPMVNPDWQYGASLAFELLYERGHRNISFLAGYDKTASPIYRNQVEVLTRCAAGKGLSIREAASYREKKKAIGRLMDQEPYLAPYYKNPRHRRLFKLDNDGTDALLSQLMMCVPFLQDKEVAKELEKVVADPVLPKELSSIAKALSDGGSLPNLYPNGSFEDPVFEPYTYVHREHRKRMGKRSTEKAFKGKYSCKFVPGYYTLLQLDAPARPDTFYLLTLKVFVPKSSAETHMKFAVYPRKDDVHQDYRRLPKLDVTQGEWMTLTAYCRTKKNSNGIRGFLFLHNFDPKCAAYIDDVRLTEIK